MVIFFLYFFCEMVMVTKPMMAMRMSHYMAMERIRDLVQHLVGSFKKTIPPDRRCVKAKDQYGGSLFQIIL